MTYTYTAMRVTPPGPNASTIGEEFECTASCAKFDDKHDVIHITSVNEVSPIVVASIPIRNDSGDAVTIHNWVDKLLENKGIPVFPTPISLPHAAKDARNFETMAFALIAGQIVFRFGTRNFSEGNFILGVKSTAKGVSTVRPIRDAIVFETPSETPPSIGYTQSNLIAMYRDADNQVKQYMMTFDRTIPFSETALMFLRDKTPDVLGYFDRNRTDREADDLELKQCFSTSGDIVASWFSSKDGRLQFVTSKDEVINLVFAAQLGILHSGREGVLECLNDFTTEYLEVINRSGDRTADVIKLCMQYISV